MIAPWHYVKAWREARDKSFAWKVRRRMKHDRNPLLITVQDKYMVKQYARDRGVASSGVLYVTDKPETIPFGHLPEHYFIKATHGCTWNIACINAQLYRFGHGDAFINRDGSPKSEQKLRKYRLTREECVALCRNWLKKKHRKEEWAYQHIPPRIIVEEPVQQLGGDILREYKLFAMSGQVKAIAVIGAIFRINGNDRLFFDRDWNPLPLTRKKITIHNNTLWNRPETLEEMVEAAERLSKDLDFIRVDLYNSTQGVLLGEMTVYPFAGEPGTPSSCPVLNKWLGDQWTLPFYSSINP